MNAKSPKMKCALAMVVSGILVATPVLAAHGDKDWDKGEKGWKEEKGWKKDKDDRWDKGYKADKGDKGEGRYGKGSYFDERRHVIVREYYVERHKEGRCPPGLKKKHNGCMPPGLERKWTYGRPLPPDVVYYEVPQPLVAQIGPPPSGYRYVRVASDILLIALGTGIVADAIADLGR